MYELRIYFLELRVPLFSFLPVGVFISNKILFMNGDVNIASVASLSQSNTIKYKHGLLKFIKM